MKPLLRATLLFACGFAACAATSDSGSKIEKQQAQSQRSIAESLTAISALEISKDQRPDKTIEPCKIGDDRRYSDLCAQWKAADAAASSAYWTQSQFWAGLLLGLSTLGAAIAAAFYARAAAVHADRSANEAKRSADAAQEQMALARQMDRPYLTAIAPTLLVEGSEMPSVAVAVSFTIENSGKGPAFVELFGVEVKSHTEPRAYMKSDTRLFKMIAEGATVVVPDNGGRAGVEQAVYARAFSECPAVITDLRIFVQYRDIFGVRRRTFSGYARCPKDGSFVVLPSANPKDWEDFEIDPNWEPGTPSIEPTRIS
jgi:hypothetical protein